MSCNKTDCPIFNECDKEDEQTFYCRKVELLVHISKLSPKAPLANYVNMGLPSLTN